MTGTTGVDVLLEANKAIIKLEDWHIKEAREGFKLCKFIMKYDSNTIIRVYFYDTVVQKFDFVDFKSNFDEDKFHKTVETLRNKYWNFHNGFFINI